ncbi:hypothetical protein HDU81_008961 [Chytriomyces hyalinus]|nr:hypothetical protein HDU81_008961 [Chytriomyces hyalinus]
MPHRGAGQATSRRHPRWTLKVSHAFDKAHTRAKELACQWSVVANHLPDPTSEGYGKVSPMLQDRDCQEQQPNLNANKKLQKPVLLQTIVAKDMITEIESVAQRTASYPQIPVVEKQQLDAQEQHLAMKKERRKTTIPPPHNFQDKTSSSSNVPSSFTIPTRTMSLSFKPVAFELDEIDLHVAMEKELEKGRDTEGVTRQHVSASTKTIYPQQQQVAFKSCLKGTSHTSSNVAKKCVHSEIEESEITLPRCGRHSMLQFDQQRHKGLERSGSYETYLKLKQNMVRLDLSLEEFRRMRSEGEEEVGLLESMQRALPVFTSSE